MTLCVCSQGSACEIMMLRTARRYDLATDTVVFANGMPFTRENMRFAGLKEYVGSMFHFCKGMGVMEVDNAEYALLTALCIFQGNQTYPIKWRTSKAPESSVSRAQRRCKFVSGSLSLSAHRSNSPDFEYFIPIRIGLSEDYTQQTRYILF